MSLTEGRTRACLMCFEKKLKCDRQLPCSKCVKRKTTCTYSHSEKPRKRPQRNAKRIKEMEARLQAMEAMIVKSANMSIAQDLTVVSSSGSRTPSAKPAINSSLDHVEDFDEVFHFDVQDASVPLTQWKMIKHQGPSRQLVKRPLPSAEEALSLLDEYFTSFNNVFPLLDEPDFMRRLQDQYYSEPLADLAWWTALNVALALAYRMRGMRTLQTTECNNKACGYLQNALNIVQDVILRKPDLLSVSALFGIAIILQGSPNPRPASLIVAAAVKLAQSLGLHRQSTLVDLSESQAEQCKRVFWFGYMLDKDFSLQLDQPPVQTDSDFDIELPAEDPEDGLGMILVGDEGVAINIFRLRIQLSTIQSETYTTLYSVQGSRLSPSARALVIENLENRLTGWKQSIPLDFGPESLMQFMAPGAIVHLVVLYMAYFNCLTMIHSMSFRGEYWIASTQDTVEGTLAGDPISVGRTMCLPAARLAVRLVSLLPAGDFACIWLLLHYYVSALVIILANIIQHPTDPSARTDMMLVEPLLRMLASLTVDESMHGGEDLRQVQRFCSSVEKRAIAASDRAQSLLQPGNSWLESANVFAVDSQAG